MNRCVASVPDQVEEITLEEDAPSATPTEVSLSSTLQHLAEIKSTFQTPFVTLTQPPRILDVETTTLCRLIRMRALMHARSVGRSTSITPTLVQLSDVLDKPVEAGSKENDLSGTPTTISIKQAIPVEDESSATSIQMKLRHVAQSKEKTTTSRRASLLKNDLSDSHTDATDGELFEPARKKSTAKLNELQDVEMFATDRLWSKDKADTNENR